MELGETAAKAAQLVGGDRHELYGDPFDDYTRTVRLFELLTGIGLTVEQAVIFMQCVKMSRAANAFTPDNMVDLCGYSDIRNYVHQRQLERDSQICSPSSNSPT